jgi:hypothetical protein
VSQERWDVQLRVLDGPMASPQVHTLRGPVVPIGGAAGAAGLTLEGYRGVDTIQCRITVFPGGQSEVAAVGSNPVRVAPHRGERWGELQPIRGPVPLSAGAVLYLGPVGRGVSVEFVKAERFGAGLQSGRLLSDAEEGGAVVRISESVANRPPDAIPARVVRVGGDVPRWFFGMVAMATGTSLAALLAVVVPILWPPPQPATGPVEAGEEYYETVEIAAVEKVRPELRDGLQQPFWDFVMGPNTTAAAGTFAGLEKFEKWDQKFYQYTTAHVQQQSRAWNFYARLEQIKDNYAQVVMVLRQENMPEVLAAVPYAESRYKAEATSFACAAGYWQFMPETGKRFGIVGNRCRLRDSSEPYDVLPSPPPLARSPYILGASTSKASCRIAECDTDLRRDITRSTRAAAASLKQAFQDRELRSTGAVVQLTILSHHAGYLDTPEKYVNMLPSVRQWAQLKGKDALPYFYGSNLTCGQFDPKSESPAELTKSCGSVVKMQAHTQHYAYGIVATHMLAVCYFARNYPGNDVFKKWSYYWGPGGYCEKLGVPSSGEVRARHGR